MVHGAGECLGPVRDISKRLIFFRIFSDDIPNTSEKIVGWVYMKCMPQIQVKF